jgi:hypothetical protein
MKGVNSIKNIASKGLMALSVLFFISTGIFAAPHHHYVISSAASQRIFEKDRLQIFHTGFSIDGNKKTVLKFAAFRTKKSNILAEADLVIAQIESRPFVFVAEPHAAFYKSLSSLQVVYHFTSRGPPSV